MSEKDFGLKNVEPKEMLVQKYFWFEKSWVGKKFYSEKFVVPKKYFSPKNPVGPKKFFWSEKGKSTRRPAVLRI